MSFQGLSRTPVGFMLKNVGILVPGAIFCGSSSHLSTHSGLNRSCASMRLGARSLASLPGGIWLLVGWQLVHLALVNNVSPARNCSGFAAMSVEINAQSTLSTAEK